MQLEVAIQIELSKEASSAAFAKESFPSCVNFNMFVQIGLLRERQLASWIMAHVGSLFGVNSQMIVEIMPLSEYFAAPVMSTAQKANNFSRQGISVLKYEEIFSFRNMLLDSDLTQIKIF